MRIVFIGAGNLATNLAMAFCKKGFDIVQVYSHMLAHAQQLASKTGATACCDLADLQADADLYIYSVKDQALSDVIRQVKVTNGLHVHTAGSMQMSLFEGNQQNYGVLYPLQTFSKEHLVDFLNIPLFIEANNAANLEALQAIASTISSEIYQLSSDGRQTLHLAGVFANNFSNCLYAIAAEVLKTKNLPFSVLLPLIYESVAKLQTLSPIEAQTGPAKRNDQNVINQQLQMLSQHADWQKIYQLLTDTIIQQQKK